MHPWHTVGADYFTISNQDFLLIVDSWTPAVVIKQHTTPHSYVMTNGTFLRRNRKHSKKITKSKPLPIVVIDDDEVESEMIPNSSGSVGGEVLQPSSERRLRFGQVIRPPKRYIHTGVTDFVFIVRYLLLIV